MCHMLHRSENLELANVDINTEHELGKRGLLRGIILEKVRKHQAGM